MSSSTRAVVLCGAVVALMTVPTHQATARRTCFSSSSPWPWPSFAVQQGARCGRGRAHGHPRQQSTALAAASKNKNKSKKKKNSGAAGHRSDNSSSSGGGGFGAAASAPAAAAATSPPIAAGESRPLVGSKSTAAPKPAASAAAGQLPDDDFATFPPLSPDNLKSVMGVDVFDLPPTGIPASERGQEQALPPQVLECIRSRHGLEEFAGGRRILDPEYTHETDAQEDDEKREGGGEGLLFPGLRLLHAEPPVIGVDDFFTPGECDEYVSRSLSPPPAAPASAGAAGENGPHMQRSATLGADVDAVAQVRLEKAPGSPQVKARSCGPCVGF